MRNAITIQFRKAIDRFLGEFGCGRGIFILEAIDGAMLSLFQPPGAAQVNHAKSSRKSLGHQRARRFVRSGEKQKFCVVLLQRCP